MSERDSRKSTGAPQSGGTNARAAEKARLAAALRANLQKRKQQARARAAGAGAPDGASGPGGADEK